jgi:cell wall assembly regulator SMI1
MKELLIILKELYKFSNDILTLEPPVNNQEVISFEKKYNLRLPNDYKYLLQIHNGIDLMGVSILGISPDSSYENLENVYHFEHFETAIPQFYYLVPFSNDGGGNFYCFDTRFANDNIWACPIVFWVSNAIYNEEEQPEIVNDSISDWIKEVIESTLEEYDYKGNPC